MILTFAGGHVSGFSPRLRSTTVVMKRSSLGNTEIRLALMSRKVSCKYDISGKKKEEKGLKIGPASFSRFVVPRQLFFTGVLYLEI